MQFTYNALYFSNNAYFANIYKPLEMLINVKKADISSPKTMQI